MRQPVNPKRRGAVLPLVAVLMVPIMAIMALAIDLGMFVLARSQMQSAADSAALAGVRRLDGDYSGSHNGNYGTVNAAAQNAVSNNKVLNREPFDAAANGGTAPGTTATNIGHFDYSTASSSFQAIYPSGSTPQYDPVSGAPLPWSLVKSDLTYQVPSVFGGRVLGYSGPTINTRAVAVHRPRDVALILDLSGSMGYDSVLGVNWNGQRYKTNNPDRAFPRFGHYGYAYSQFTAGVNLNDNAMFLNAAVNSGDRQYNPGNLTVNPSSVNATFLDAPPIVENFVTQNGANHDPAWPAADFPAVSSDSYLPANLTLPLTGSGSANTFQDLPGGDRPFLAATTAGMNLGTSYARTFTELTRNSSTTVRDAVHVRTFPADFEIRGYGMLERTDGAPRFAGNLSASHKTSTLDADNGFAGYTQGPRYWGKTFWQWPADPRAPVTASARLVWNAGTSRWERNSTQGLLNQWLVELDRNWILLPNGRRANDTNNQNGVLGLTRYAAGSYDALLANWPVLADGSANPSPWTRAQVENFLRAKGVVTLTLDLRTTSTFTTPQNRLKSGTTAALGLNNLPVNSAFVTTQYRSPPTPPSGVSWQYGSTAGFHNVPIIYADTGLGVVANIATAANRWFYPRCKWDTATNNWSADRTDGNLRLEGTPYQTPGRRQQVSGVWTTVDDDWVAPSPTLLPATGGLPTGPIEWATTPTQTQLDAQIARLILDLYDNAKADYDWRKLYFRANASPANWPDNTVLFQSRAINGGGGSITGHYQRVPEHSTGTTTYSINYPAILNWIKNIGPNPFPPNLRSGRVVYYSAIPDAIALPVPTDPDQLFWKEYIDWCLGFSRTGSDASLYQETQTYSGFGRDIAWPDAANVVSSMNTKPAGAALQGGSVRNSNDTTLNLPNWTGKAPFQRYADNPMRPRTRLWFGPMTMIDFVINSNLGIPIPNRNALAASGAIFQSQAAACKQGVRAALLDSKQNHPNDHMSLIFFAANNGGSGALETKRYHTARQAMGTEYGKMIDYLFFPPSTVRGERTEINWTDPEMVNVPNAHGGTCYDWPLLLAFNQFSTNSTLHSMNSPAPLGNAGGLGRRGAQKIVIFETDGMPNNYVAVPTVQGSGDGAYYNVNAATNVSVTSGSGNYASIIQQLVRPTSMNGFSYPGKPALVHTIGYGFIFEPTFTGTDTAAALTALGAMQSNGNVSDAADGLTLFSHPTAGASTLASIKVITGDFETRVDKMRKAFTRILQEKTVQVSLVE